jgi:DNA-binding MarR family transcriptional regulator
MSAKKRDKSRYKLETVTRACTILRHFSDVQQALSLGDIVERTGLERTIVFRILKTLEEEGLLRRPEGLRFAESRFILTGCDSGNSLGSQPSPDRSHRG